MKSGHRVATVFAALAIASTFGVGLVRAETTGDLYVASAGGILEVITSSGSVLNTVPVSPRPGSIAIRPDGRELFALAGGRAIVRIDLEAMAVTSRVALPATGAALAFPRGEQLVAALPTLRQLEILDTGTGRLSQSDQLPGAVNLLAADRRDPRVVAAASAGHWVAVLDPGTGSVRSTTIRGSVAAVAFDGSTGIVIVATTAPNRLVGLDLRDFTIAWSMPLSAVPSAVAVAADRTLVAAGQTIWAMESSAAPGWPFVGVPSAEAVARPWASLARPATALTMSDDGTYLYALEADRVEGFPAQRPASAERSSATTSATPGATRTVRLAGSHAPFAVVAVPGAKPLNGGPGNAVSSGAPAPAASGPAVSPSKGPVVTPPRTDTVLDGAGRWIDDRPILPGAVLVGLVILVVGVFAIRWYERRGEA